MAEVLKSTNSGEMAAQFIEFVMMQAQNASLFLGLIPNPQSGKGEVNLQLARLFIDQLTMIQEKTRGNLTGEEEKVLRNALSRLQMAFVEVSQDGGAPVAAGDDGEEEEAGTAIDATPPAAPAEESRKRFSKSYGG